jgi:hypothetical protein
MPIRSCFTLQGHRVAPLRVTDDKARERFCFEFGDALPAGRMVALSLQARARITHEDADETAGTLAAIPFFVFVFGVRSVFVLFSFVCFLLGLNLVWIWFGPLLYLCVVLLSSSWLTCRHLCHEVHAWRARGVWLRDTV